MANTAFGNPVGGFWPLGQITVVVSGTPVPLTSNVGPQLQTPGALRMSKRARQFIFFNAKIAGGVAGTIFILKKGYTKNDTNGIVLAIPVRPTANDVSPLPQSIPHGALLEGALVAPDDLVIDSDVSGSSISGLAIYG